MVFDNNNLCVGIRFAIPTYQAKQGITTHVIAFTVQPGVIIHDGPQMNEARHKGTMRRPRQIQHVLYQGRNPFGE